MTILRSIDFSRATASAICKQLQPVCADACQRHASQSSTSIRQSAASAAAAGLVRSPFLARRSASRMSSSVSTSRASATSPIGRPMTWRPSLVELDLDADLAVLEALEHAAEALAARDQLLHLDLGLVARPVLEVRRPHQRPVDAGRGNLQRVLALRSGRARRAAARVCARSPRNPRSSSCRPARSAMICTVLPSRPETATRTRRKPQVAEHRLGQAGELGGQRRSRQ